MRRRSGSKAVFSHILPHGEAEERRSLKMQSKFFCSLVRSALALSYQTGNPFFQRHSLTIQTDGTVIIT